MKTTKNKGVANLFNYPSFDINDSDYALKNIDYRQKIWNKAATDIEMQSLLLSISSSNILFWFNTFLYTYNPRLSMPHLPFITYPFQDEFILDAVYCIENYKDLFTDKSRDMGVTWLVLGIFLWGWLFKGWQLRIGSRTRDLVDKGGDMDSLFEKLRYMLERMPSWMLPYKFSTERGTQNNSLCKLVNPQNKNSIIGEATGPNFGRGGRSKAIFYDEFSVWMCAEEAWKAGADTTNCRIAVGTPRGKGNKFADIKFDEETEIVKRSLHWTLHPLKTQEWYNDEASRRTPEEIAQELDISYEASAVGRVYEDFSTVPIGETSEFDYDSRLPLFCAWDFGEGGKDPTSILWIQMDPANGEVRVIDNYEKAGRDINYFGHIINGVIDGGFVYDNEAIIGIDRRKHWKAAIHVGDPYNGKKTTFVGQTTIEKELRKHGISMNLKRGAETVKGRIDKVIRMLPRMSVHSRCQGFIDSMQNSRWGSMNRLSERTTPVTKPIHNKFSHFRSSIEYFADFEDGYRPVKKTHRFIQKTIQNTGYQDRYRKILRQV